MLHSQGKAEHARGWVGTRPQKAWAFAVHKAVTWGVAIVFREQNPAHVINAANLNLISLKQAR